MELAGIMVNAAKNVVFVHLFITKRMQRKIRDTKMTKS